jgi:tripartite-type tricarboxylate transporter receptor subunit TctC
MRAGDQTIKVERYSSHSPARRAPKACPTCLPLEEAGFKTWCSNPGTALSCRPGRRPIIAYPNAAMAMTVADSATRESLLQIATEPVGGIPEAFARVVREDSAKYARLAKELGIRIN